MDELERKIDVALTDPGAVVGTIRDGESQRNFTARAVANAVRAYLESDEVVERVARALLEATGDGLLWDHLAARGQSEYLADASAALQAAGGKQ